MRVEEKICRRRGGSVGSSPNEVEEDLQEEGVVRSVPHRMRVEEEDLQEERVVRSIPHQMRVEEQDLQEELLLPFGQFLNRRDRRGGFFSGGSILRFESGRGRGQ